MRYRVFLNKVSLLSLIALVGLSTLSYACGMGAKAPSGGDSSAPPEEKSAK